MPKPKTKNELLEQSDAGFSKLQQLVTAMTPDEQSKAFPPGTLNRNIRDVLAHLHHWHLLLLKWYEVGMSGEKPAMPAEGYTWKTTADLNREIRKQYLDSSLKEVNEQLFNSHYEVHQLIDQHTNEDLFEKKKYHWTGSTSLGAYLISATSSHYNWAYKLIRKAKKGSF